jgi:hypothetical protein
MAPRKIGQDALSQTVIEIESSSAIAQLPVYSVMGSYLFEGAPGVELRGLDKPTAQVTGVNP